MVEILENGPYDFGGNLFIIKEGISECNLPRSVPFWVKFYNLPLKFRIEKLIQL